MAFYPCKVYSGGGGGSSDIDGFLDGTVTSVTSSVTSLRDHALRGVSNLVSASLPNVTTLGEYALASCDHLTSLTLGALTSIGQYGLYDVGTNNSGIEIVLNNCAVGGYAFQNSGIRKISGTWASGTGTSICRGCTSLEYLEFSLASMGAYFINGCTSLADLYLTNTSGVVSPASTSLTNVPNSCTVHVPADLLTAYQANSSWSRFNLVAIT